MKLGIEPFEYRDLYDYARLEELARAFDDFLRGNDDALSARFESYRAQRALTEPEESALLIDVSKHVGAFLERLFNTDSSPVRLRTQRDATVARFKKEFVTKRVARIQPPEGTERFTHAVNVLVGAQDGDFEYALAVARRCPAQQRPVASPPLRGTDGAGVPNHRCL